MWGCNASSILCDCRVIVRVLLGKVSMWEITVVQGRPLGKGVWGPKLLLLCLLSEAPPAVPTDHVAPVYCLPRVTKCDYIHPQV